MSKAHIDVADYGDITVSESGPFIGLDIEDPDLTEVCDVTKAGVRLSLAESKALRKALKRQERRTAATWGDLA